ncbi:hypothetical protein CHS0354_006417 [Potamilus streckersoni]|uniref:G-protein coupled receptors family 1 profile domain-containing protein n=1 Tax=Potamilus streckersoni TaxID=2493646 RepID=A0AAE0T981_9BIVA|nr:hypothetical protein CHS0354_006417 [Potamilus streckersoni]
MSFLHNFTFDILDNTTSQPFSSGTDLVNNKCAEIWATASEPPPLYGEWQRYLIGIVLCLFPVLTILGNGLVILAVLTHKRLKTVTNVFVVSLAAADMLVAIFVMPFGIYLQMNNKEWYLGHLFCLVTTSFDVMFTTTSIFNLSCLAIDRYLAICRPFLHERLSNKVVVGMLAFCWIVPMFISFVPILNKWNLIGIEEYVDCLYADEHHCAFVVNIPYAMVCSLIAFYIPTVFICICNVKIFMAARKQAHQIRSLEISAHKHHRKGKLKHETKAAKTVGIIMGCFFICWLPFFVMNIIDPLIGYKIPYTPWTIALWLGYINSMLNPILYYTFNRHYKLAFKRIISCKLCRGISEYEDDVVPSQIAHYSDLNHSTSTSLHLLTNSTSNHSELKDGHNKHDGANNHML